MVTFLGSLSLSVNATTIYQLMLQATLHTGFPSSKYVVYATACLYTELYGKIADRKKIWKLLSHLK